MNTHSIKRFPVLLLLGSLLSLKIWAEPYLAYKNNLFCNACHVNPIGGGQRNSFGTYYGNNVLPQHAGSPAALDIGTVTDTLHIGSNFRANYSMVEPEKGESSRTFEVQSGQLYFLLQPKDSRFSLYIDEQLAPGGAINREAFILTKIDDKNSLKVGRLMLPYGIRLEDDTAFIRQSTGFNFDNSDSGIEWNYINSHWHVSAATSNGTSSTTNNDNKFLYLSRAEYLGPNWRLGVSGVLNNSALGDRYQANIFGGFNWMGFTFLAEIDHVNDKSISHVAGTTEKQRIGFIEVNRELTKGFNLKVTSEYFDPDTHINENQRIRNSIVAEYTPFSNLQIRSGFRKGEDIPQRTTGNYLNFFTQLHFYY